MNLQNLLRKRRLVLLGLNSGTSADGLDMAAVRFTPSKNVPGITYLSGRHKSYPARLRHLALALADSTSVPLEDIIALDNLLGKFYGRAAANYIDQLQRSGIKVDAICSHGQTVRHVPNRRAGATVAGSMQLGSRAMIAAQTGKVVIGDFRQADIALGNEGAPITTSAMRQLFASERESRLLVNIGGIANFFYFPMGSSGMEGADCGPGNSLSDILTSTLFGQRYDRGGRRAKRGTVSQRLLTLMRGNAFFNGKQISTGRELFGKTMAQEMIDFGKRFRLSDDDLIATAGELTAVSIAERVRPVTDKDKNISKLYLTGGGRKNMFFTGRLHHYLPDLQIVRVDDLGIDGDFVEAVAYAVLGEATVRSRTVPVQPTGRSRSRWSPILGEISQPPERT